MSRSIKIFLSDASVPVGTLYYDRQGAREHATFAYDEAWLESTDRFSLGPALPLLRGPQFHRKTQDGSVFHGPFADTEPDGWGRRVILRDHAKLRQLSTSKRNSLKPESTTPAAPLNALDFLLAVDDASRVGALRFQDEQGNFCRASLPGQRTTPPIIELKHLLAASRAVEMGNETAADLAYLRGKGTSLGGMRPKCTILDEDGRLSIGKFPSVSDERSVTKGEVLAMHLAKLAGINTAEARLVESGGIPVALIQRFDRTVGNKRLMYVSAATLLGADRASPQEHFYTEIVDAIRQFGAAAQADIEELWRRIAFSILITNIDEHLHNHGFLHVSHGQWRLSPAFDLNPFPERIRELKTWVSEEAGPAATIDALMSVTPYFKIQLARARAILKEVNKAVSQWRNIGQKLGMITNELESFADAFEHSERAAAAKAVNARG